jgi:hypothetical protein
VGRIHREGGDAVNLISNHDRAGVRDLRPRRQAAAETRLVVALRSLLEAQRLIEEAAVALESVSGMGREWRRLDALHEQVKRVWYDVRGRSDTLSLKDRLLLDHEPGPDEARWTALLSER